MTEQIAHSTYLVNGLPSLLARRVLEQVLCFEPRARVFSIIHADDTDYVTRQMSQLEASQQSRVELLTGDITALDYGLSGSEYLSLTRRIRRVHHVVAPSSVYVDASNHANVGAALGREVVEFARAASCLENFIVYSSAGVSGDRTGSVMEDELVEGQGFPRHFEQALALMELMLQRAKTQIPALVLRPTLLAADSQTGECERASPLYRLVETILTAPKTQPLRAPNERSPLHLVAVDYVARAAYYLGRRSDTAGRTLHLADAHPTRMTHVLNLLLNACGHVQGKPALGSAFNQRIQQPISEWSRVCAALRSPHVLYDARQASSLLASSGIACPPFQDYADKLVDFVRRKRI